MKDILTYLVSQIVEYPDDVRIDEQDHNGTIVLTIHAHPDDMGKIIGKSGRIIRAIRDIVKILATKQNRYVDVVVAEDRDQVQPVTQ